MAFHRTLAAIAALCLAACTASERPAPAPRHAAPKPEAEAGRPAELRARVLAAMKRATRFMVERVSHRGGYLWAYLPDLSRRWGELEAYESMVWVQPPGTATVGHVLLDAYRVTGDDDYYEAAARAGDALVEGQLASGGWNYLIDFAGEASLRRWYDTIGKNAWRLEEFHHYYGNATFDDGGTAESTRLLIRLFLERREEKYGKAARRALEFVLESQHENGCFPQRHPMPASLLEGGQPAFPGYSTFNDDVAAENIDVLITYQLAIGDERIPGTVTRAMDCFLELELPAPQSGWSLQYGPDSKPAAARSYEPASVSTTATAENLAALLDFHALTGQAKYLEPIPRALHWLESVRLEPASDGAARFPAQVELGNNRPLFVHRRGSNVTNGKYWADHDPRKPILHTKQIKKLALDEVRARYQEQRERPVDRLSGAGPLWASAGRAETELPRLFTGLTLPLLGAARPRTRAKVTRDDAERLVRELDAAGYWPAKLERISHPYRGPAPAKIAPGDFSEAEVGDEYDTSPYRSPEAPLGISTKIYVKNMFQLIRYLDESRP